MLFFSKKHNKAGLGGKSRAYTASLRISAMVSLV